MMSRRWCHQLPFNDSPLQVFVGCFQMTKKHHNGHMMKCDWLDRLSFREIEMINEKQKRESNFMYLNIEFPQVVYEGHEYTVLYYEQVIWFLLSFIIFRVLFVS
jgi:hypothetical protein